MERQWPRESISLSIYPDYPVPAKHLQSDRATPPREVLAVAISLESNELDINQFAL